MATSTPWGPSQSADKLAPGIMAYTTAGHGGYHLAPTQNRKVPIEWRSYDGWYEEDCGWAPVALTFPHLFPEHAQEAARDMLPHWINWVIKWNRR